MLNSPERLALRDRCAAGVVRLLLHVLALLPLRVSRGIGCLIGRLNLVAGTKSVRVTRRNLALCFPDQEESDREAMAARSIVHTAQTLMETPAVWLGDLEALSRQIIDVENEQLFLDCVESGRGCVVLLPHLGNWEVFNVYLASRHVSSTVLYKTPRHTWLRGIMAEIRQRYGNELVPTDVRGISRLFKALKQGRVVTVLPDQVPVSGEFVPFFGHLALTDRLVARLIARSGAPAVCVTVPRCDGGYRVRFTAVDPGLYEPETVDSLTGLNASIEACVLKDREQYQWEYKRYRERPTGEKSFYH